MDVEEVGAQVLALPEIQAWPDMLRIFKYQANQPNQVWDWPIRACRAVGGEESLAASSAAAILCLMPGAALIDDMLDQDPRGEHLRLGDAAAANLSFAFQAASFKLISQTPVDAERRSEVLASFAQMALTIAYGQELDKQNLSGEENYWKVTHAKSSSYFGAAMYAGAVIGNASPDIAARLRHLGELTGDVIQLHDDIRDAFETPANPDWKQMRNNLLFLFAQTADHLDRDRFLDLRPRVDDPKALKEAQKILVQCGAVSYGMYLVCQRYMASKKILEETQLADPAPLREVIVKYVRPLADLLREYGIEVPAEIAAV
jgi:geranylgeranyl pyrophosphate synthase